LQPPDCHAELVKQALALEPALVEVLALGGRRRALLGSDLSNPASALTLALPLLAGSCAVQAHLWHDDAPLEGWLPRGPSSGGRGGGRGLAAESPALALYAAVVADDPAHEALAAALATDAPSDAALTALFEPVFHGPGPWERAPLRLPATLFDVCALVAAAAAAAASATPGAGASGARAPGLAAAPPLAPSKPSKVELRVRRALELRAAMAEEVKPMGLPTLATRDGAALSPDAVELVGVAGKANEYLFGSGQWDQFDLQLGPSGAIAGAVPEVLPHASAVFRQTVIDATGVADSTKCKTSGSQLYLRKVRRKKSWNFFFRMPKRESD
jgi:hypothetical protein